MDHEQHRLVGHVDGTVEQMAPSADWINTMIELDECDGYVVIAVDPQTGEVDAHGPFEGIGAVSAADHLRTTLDREELDDVVVRIVRWHTSERAA